MAGDASRLNGKKGGRPKGYAALEAERQREYVAKILVTEFAPIVEKAIEQAKSGDKFAREWLADRAYGKPQQFTDLTNDGQAFPTPILSGITGITNELLTNDRTEEDTETE